nr:pentapeptide repeat-containing protein [Rhodococcus sp. 15-1154-1]
MAYRRQKSTERALVLNHRSVTQASESLKVSSDTLLLSQQQFKHEGVRILRERYTAATEQLGASSFAVRLAGLYAIAALADDWRNAGNTAEQQVCVDVICGYLRTPTIPMKDVLSADGEERFGEDFKAGAAAEHEVRRTAVRIIAERTRPRLVPFLAQTAEGTGQDEARSEFVDGPWADRTINLAGAELIEANFSSCTFERLDLSSAILINTADFSNSVIHEGLFVGTTFVMKEDRLLPGKADFCGATMRDVKFDDARVFTSCTFITTRFDGTTSFDGTTFAGGLSFSHATFAASSITSFPHAYLGNEVTFANAQFEGEVDLTATDLSNAAVIRFDQAGGSVPPSVDWDSARTPRISGWPWPESDME